MYFCEVWLRGVRGIFSWHSENLVPVGSRVVVSFRNRKKVGIVIGFSDKKPDFATQPVLEIWDTDFLPPAYIDIARETARENICPLEKVLELMIPEKFFAQKNPEEREVFYSLQTGADTETLRGEKQKVVLDLLSKHDGEISSEILRAQVPLATIQGLEKKGILTSRLGAIHPAKLHIIPQKKNHTLTADQNRAIDEILSDDRPSLLFGVTGSGKTEVYKSIAAHVLSQNPKAQILFLLPEIALTPQLLAEFHDVFGSQVAVWHSKLSEGEKIQEWRRVASGEAQILIGARSAAFVPLQNVRLIILDEEHEWTFKNEFQPRVWTHDLVEKIAQKFNARLIVGSATPRLESFEKCFQNKWKLVRLPNRVTEVQLPEIELISLRDETKKGNNSPISERLLFELQELVARKKQAVIFLNQRGFSGSTMCRMCGQEFACPHCSHNMKLHRKGSVQKFICHVCGHLENFPSQCPTCHAQDFEFRGWGTQQVEQELQSQIPGIRVLRADADSVTGKHDFRDILKKFHAQEADVLLGTQMIAKGLDFENVELVGVILADIGLGLPDFRAEERVFQLLTQVSGRAGRRQTRGKIVIQTFRPDDEIFSFVRNHDTEGFIARQREHRKTSGLPPFCALAKVTISHTQKEEGLRDAKRLFETTKNFSSPDYVLDIQLAPAFFPKAFGKYHFHVFIRAPKRENLLDLFSKIQIPTTAKVDFFPSSLL